MGGGASASRPGGSERRRTAGAVERAGSSGCAARRTAATRQKNFWLRPDQHSVFSEAAGMNLRLLATSKMALPSPTLSSLGGRRGRRAQRVKTHTAVLGHSQFRMVQGARRFVAHSLPNLAAHGDGRNPPNRCLFRTGSKRLLHLDQISGQPGLLAVGGRFVDHSLFGRLVERRTRRPVGGSGFILLAGGGDGEKTSLQRFEAVFWAVISQVFAGAGAHAMIARFTIRAIRRVTVSTLM